MKIDLIPYSMSMVSDNAHLISAFSLIYSNSRNKTFARENAGLNRRLQQIQNALTSRFVDIAKRGVILSLIYSNPEIKLSSEKMQD